MLSEARQHCIYLVRHGETLWNLSGRLQGHLDSPLTAAGIDQARAVSGVLRHEIPDLHQVCIETSPLGRAYETAKIIAEGIGIDSRALVLEPLLSEHHLGEWQGLTRSEINSRFPGALPEREKRKWEYTVPGGESYARVAARARQWLSRDRPSITTIAVTHEMMSRTIQGAYTNLTIDQTLARSHRHDRIYRLCNGINEEISLALLPHSAT